MNEKNFYIFSWRRPFLTALKDFVVEKSGNQPGNALIITPNRRPARYMVDLFRKEKSPLILPKMLTISDVVGTWRASLSTVPLRMANIFDRAALLYECVAEIARHKNSLGHYFSRMSMADFLPWGIRLAGILEDFYREDKPFGDLQYMDGEVSPPAAAILESLREIGQAYGGKLEEKQWTTQGYDQCMVAANAANIPDLLRPMPDRPVFIAGFYMLSGTDARIFKSLWENGAYVCLHTDPALARGEKPHWSCRRHSQWLKDWHATPVEMNGATEEKDAPETVCSFYAAYDLHSQLDAMSEVLAEPEKNRLSTAIILGKNEALMATLQNLPERSVNISMGYPMQRTPLSDLLNYILLMVENAPGPGKWRSEDVLKIVRHPYINMLKVEDDTGESVSLSGDLRRLDYAIRQGGRYWQPDDGTETPGNPAALAIGELMNFFAAVSTPKQLADAIGNMCQWLMRKGHAAWSGRYPLDVEVMYRMLNDLVPVLRNNLVADTEMPLPQLHAMLEQLIEDERIPFEADPMQGLQILGLLESRLLQFDRLIFMDASDDVMPGNTPQDPLLPDSLRSILGLPDSRRREESAAHNIYRLCRGAEKVHFIWQEGIPKGEFSDSRKIRSRFVEQFIWEAERKNPLLLEDGKGLARRPEPSINIVPRQWRPMPLSPQLLQGVEQFWSNVVSPTALGDYLKCQRLFMYKKILGLDDNDRSLESHHLLLGNLVHEILKSALGPAPRVISKGQESEEEFIARIKQAFAQEARNKNLAQKMPVEQFGALEFTIPARMREFWRAQPEEFTIAALEDWLEGKISFASRDVAFRGKLDRLDVRDGLLYIVDYKTGKKPVLNNPAFWDNTEFFARARNACQQRDLAGIDACFREMAGEIADLQLAIYFLLLPQSPYVEKYGQPANALWSLLRYAGREDLLFDPAGENADARWEHCRMAVELAMCHMCLMPEIAHAEDEKICATCAYRNLCIV